MKGSFTQLSDVPNAKSCSEATGRTGSHVVSRATGRDNSGFAQYAPRL